MALDMMGNIAPHLELRGAQREPLSWMMLKGITGGLFSGDRFRVLRSLEALKGDTKSFKIQHYKHDQLSS